MAHSIVYTCIWIASSCADTAIFYRLEWFGLVLSSSHLYSNVICDKPYQTSLSDKCKRDIICLMSSSSSEFSSFPLIATSGSNVSSSLGGLPFQVAIFDWCWGLGSGLHDLGLPHPSYHSITVPPNPHRRGVDLPTSRSAWYALLSCVEVARVLNLGSWSGSVSLTLLPAELISRLLVGFNPLKVLSNQQLLLLFHQGGTARWSAPDSPLAERGTSLPLAGSLDHAEFAPPAYLNGPIWPDRALLTPCSVGLYMFSLYTDHDCECCTTYSKHAVQIWG